MREEKSLTGWYARINNYIQRMFPWIHEKAPRSCAGLCRVFGWFVPYKKSMVSINYKYFTLGIQSL